MALGELSLLLDELHRCLTAPAVSQLEVDAIVTGIASIVAQLDADSPAWSGGGAGGGGVTTFGSSSLFGGGGALLAEEVTAPGGAPTAPVHASGADGETGAAVTSRDEFARRLCAQLLAGDRSVLTWITASATTERPPQHGVTRGREALLNIVANLLIVAGPAVLPHLVAIRNACLAVIGVETAAEPAKAALAPLVRILTFRLMTASTFLPREVWGIFIAALRSSKAVYRTVDGAKAAMMSALGHLVQAYPASIDSKLVRYAARCMS